jgi:hypothetical protein
LRSLAGWCVAFLVNDIRSRVSLSGPVDMHTLAIALGYRIQRVPDLGGPTGALMGRMIAILEGLGQVEEAITIGHELAHAINDEWGLMGTHAPSFERCMDAVAISLLMV